MTGTAKTLVLYGTASADTESTVIPTERGTDWPAKIISQLSWSPDGTEILFVSDGVHAIQTDTGHVRTLVDGSMRTTRAAWSPDGQQVAIHHPGYQILTLARDGSDARIVMELPVDATSFSNGNAAINRSPVGSPRLSKTASLSWVSVITLPIVAYSCLGALRRT